MRKTILDRLYVGRFRGPDAIRKILDSPQPSSQSKRRTKSHAYITGVHKGNFFRIRIPPKSKPLPDVPKLPPSNPMPQPFKHPATSSKTLIESIDNVLQEESFAERLYAWFKANLPILALNFGSMCALIGFTRSDVLELRSLSMTGSIMSVFYNFGQPRVLWPPIAWSSLFAAVNGYKIFGILQERNAEVHMTDREEKIFVQFFMPHGITPKQFERIYKKAEIVRIPKGDMLIRKGDKLDHLYLVIDGATQAHILGRHITAASTRPDTRGDQKEGGDSGAWAGEMAFLDQFWEKEQAKLTKKAKQTDAEDNPVEEAEPKKVAGLAFYTIVAAEDCSVMRWSHEDMEELMNSSNDLRSGLTRAMTSALVGKVINLTISRSSKLPNWSTWLSDWTRSDGAQVNVKSIVKLPEDDRDSNKPTQAEPPFLY